VFSLWRIVPSILTVSDGDTISICYDTLLYVDVVCLDGKMERRREESVEKKGRWL
jgi:hypothetical protein